MLVSRGAHITQSGGRHGGGGTQRPQERVDIQDIPRNHTLFELYYQELRIVNDGEKEAFWEAMRRDLPNSFRFTGSKGYVSLVSNLSIFLLKVGRRAISVQQRLKDHYIPEITSIKHNGQLVEPPTSIPWYPDELAWQMITPKNVVRRFPPFASFQKWLVSETSVGNISRQEVVSMIPPLVMGVEPWMTVLDMCAAPGSKAAQLIEMIHSAEEAGMQSVLDELAECEGQARKPNPNGEIRGAVGEAKKTGLHRDDGRATGLLIANDSDYKRAHMLIHQMKRLNSPNLIVTNHDATMFPSIKLPSLPGHKGSTPPNRYLKFDRILADVPCSGDGTCRKNINVWKDWHPGNSLGLFSTQVKILYRALQMLKVGGRVVYSTCSMNPVENEAVIASVIERCGGLTVVEVIDSSSALPELKRKPGLNNWKVMDKQGKIWGSWAEVENARAKESPEGLGRLIEGMFAPTRADETIPLERCMRVYPHLQDTGAFFITVLEKKTEIKAKPQADVRKTEGKTSIIATVEEIEAKPINGANPVEKINALDDLAPPRSNSDAEGLSAAARQNKETAPTQTVTPQKRRLDDIADADAATKRPKFREEVDDAAPRGEEDRQVHYPPPPGAQLELSRPETIKLSLPAPPIRNPNQPSKRNANQAFEEPFKYLDPNHDELKSIDDFYSLSRHFPRDRFMVRNALGNPVKTIYYTSALARDILKENEAKGIKFVHCGVKMFVKQDVQKVGVCKWRIQTEGLPILQAWVGDERVVRLWRRETLHKLLLDMFPKVDGDSWKDLGEIGERVRDVSMGCCVLRVELSPDDECNGYFAPCSPVIHPPAWARSPAPQ